MSDAIANGAFDELAPGAVIDRYEILERLRDEGAAVVYRARHLDLTREVALSVLHPDALEGDPAAAQRFRESAMRLARLEHPAVAPIFSLGETGGTMWMASRLLAGTTLGEAAAAGTLTPAQTVHIIEAIADALADMHDSGIVHRDLRPDNVWLVRGRAPLIGPPGVGRSDGRTRTSTGLLLGSAQYLAPEQILGEGASPASDVFALGALAVTCLTGDSPFAGASLGRLLAMRPSAPPPSLETDDASAGAVNAAIARVMATDPAARPDSPVEAARTIAAAAGGLPHAVRERPRAFRRAAPEPEPASSGAPATPREPARPAAASAPPEPLPKSATRVDRQRPVIEAPVEVRPRTPTWQVALAVLSALALPVLCFLAGRTLAGSPEDEVGAGAFAVRIDVRWSRAEDDPPPPVREALAKPAVLRGPEDTLAVAGALAQPGPAADPLRAIAPSLLGDSGRRRVVSLRGRETVRYDGTLEGTTLRFHAAVVPTTAAPLAVLCVGPAVDAAACDALAANARLGQARPAPARPDEATAKGLAAVLTPLHNRVSTRQLALEGAKPKERESSLAAVQDVYRLALEELSRARVPARDKPVVAELSTAVRRVIAGYEALLGAGDDDLGRRRAAAAVSGLRRTVRELEELGYRVTAESNVGGA